MDAVQLLEESKAFCMLPWVHMNVATDGRVLPCCVSDWERPVGSLRDTTLQELWNSQGMRRLRLDMLASRKRSQCRHCYKLEESGFPSLRQYANKRFARHFPIARTTRPDGSLETMRLPYLDVRFSNVCNFRCRICSPEISSAWHGDAKDLWGYSGPKVLTPTKDPEELWRQIEPLLPDLEEIYFAGGEPLINDEHYRILELLAKNKLFDIRIRYHTNFFVMTHRGWDAMKLWDQFHSVEVRASLDGMGRRGEYLRKGMAWEQVLKNRKRMAEICPRAGFAVEPTVCLMNALHLPDFHKEWLEQGLIEPGRWRLHMLEFPQEYCVQALPAAFKRQVAEKYEHHIEKTLEPRRKNDERFHKTAMDLHAQGRIKTKAYSSEALSDADHYRLALRFLSARDQSSLLSKFRETTHKLDRLRGEKFSGIFPELAGLMRE